MNINNEDPLGTQPRNGGAFLPPDTLPSNLSVYLRKLIAESGGLNGPIGKQFIPQKKLESQPGPTDPLIEDQHLVAPGLVYKYPGRALWLVTKFCNSYCRFCTRGREVGSRQMPSFLTDQQIQETLSFLDRKTEVEEIILSGGDPLTTPCQYLSKIIEPLAERQKRGQIEIIRIGTRLPVVDPGAIKDWHYQLLSRIKNPYLMVHINHPSELTDKTIKVLNNFRQRSNALVLSQTVLLKGVNDSQETLIELFNKMTREGIRPYYLFQNDPVCWAKHFTVPVQKAIRLWQGLRPQLSGLSATARFVIDAPFGFGKIVVPEGNSWQFNPNFFHDFKGNKIPLV
ncbi:MAG: radical SAM protein [Patescibacteria group bacterium]